MNTFYPFTDPQLVKNIGNIPLAMEYDYDMDTAQFKMDKGKMSMVYENQALKIKIWKLFMSERYRWVVFPWSYGHELETLIGKSYTQGYINSEAERYIKEAVFKALSDYILSLDDISISFDDGVLYVGFNANTIYGNLVVDNMAISLG